MTRFTISNGLAVSTHARWDRPVFGAVVLLLSCVGCKSDLSQQLLERELRMQEDQIYQLQDELQDKCARLERVAGENTSLKRQLGFSEADGPAVRRGPSRPGGQPTPAPRSGPGQPLLVPPSIDIPGARTGTGGSAPAPAGVAPPPGAIAPPALDGVPPLPAEPRFPGAQAPDRPTVVPASATAGVDGGTPVIPAAPTPPAAAVRPMAVNPPIVGGPTDPPGTEPPTGRPLSHEESLADAGRITHLVVNPARTECFDGDGDGVSDGLAIVVEPRDGDERLVTAAGDMSISVYDASGPTGAAPLARWDIPAREAIGHFRRTSRNRGLHFVLRWPGPPPRGDHVQVQVALTTFEAASFQTDCTVAVQPPRRAP